MISKEMVMAELEKNPMPFKQLADKLHGYFVTGDELNQFSRLTRSMRDEGLIVADENRRLMLPRPSASNEEEPQEASQAEEEQPEPERHEEEDPLPVEVGWGQGLHQHVINKVYGEGEEIDLKGIRVVDEIKIKEFLINSEVRQTAKEVGKYLFGSPSKKYTQKAKEILTPMVDRGEIKRDGNGHYWVAGEDRPHPSVKNSLIKCNKLRSTGEVAMLTIEQLEKRIRPRKVERRDTKIKFLHKMADFLIENDINKEGAKMLMEIAEDIK